MPNNRPDGLARVRQHLLLEQLEILKVVRILELPQWLKTLRQKFVGKPWGQFLDRALTLEKSRTCQNPLWCLCWQTGMESAWALGFYKDNQVLRFDS